MQSGVEHYRSWRANFRNHAGEIVRFDDLDFDRQCGFLTMASAQMTVGEPGE